MADQEFDEIAAMKGLVRVLTPLLDDYLGRMKVQSTAGPWIDSTSPAIYLGHPNTPSQDHPRILITYNGDNNDSNVPFENGLVEVDDPDNPGNLITVPYSKEYLTFVLTLTCDSGDNQEVNRGNRLSSASILRKFRERLKIESFRKTVHTEVNSSINTIMEITPTYKLEDTSYHNSSVMSLSFDTISTIYDYESYYFDTIEVNSEVYNISEDDPDPHSNTITVGPVP